MVSESALAILLERHALPPLADGGGVLTAMTALGDVLVARLRATGKFSFESEIIEEGKDEVNGKSKTM